MKTKSVFLMVVVLLGLLFSFCKKEDSNSLPPTPTSTPTPPKPYRTVYVSNELKEWGLFNVGSYWIYRDSITGSTDSVYVSSINTSFEDLIEDHKLPFDSIASYETIHIKVKGFSNDFYTLRADDRISYPTSMPYSTTLPCFVLDTTFFNPDPLPQANNTISSVSVPGNVYTGIRHFRLSICYSLHSGNHYCMSESHFWKKNAGKIKFRDYNTSGPNSNGVYSCREVIRYHVTQ